MATKNDKLGLLSKMAKFVRNPTKDWADLDSVESPEASGYDKQALKAMIERKRQNDFIRKREFDQLRKVRNSKGDAKDIVAIASVFQNSLANDTEDRAMTLKKIDEIEAQMSKQWWRGKKDASALSTMHTEAAPTRQPGDSFAPTQTTDSTQHAGDFLPTEMGDAMVPVRAREPVAEKFNDTNTDFSASNLFAADIDDLAPNPELDEASIRFANGDDSGAEEALVQALRSPALAPQTSAALLAALLDFYRVSDNQIAFGQAVAEFGALLGGITPAWINVSADAQGRDAEVVNAAPIWVCPPALTVAALEALRDAMGLKPMPWYLDWSALERVEESAMPLMDGLFASVCVEPVSLRFDGAETLVQVLRTMMPAGNRDIEPKWWVVYLNVLRALQKIDEFEVAALDYCLTYEVAPPAWESARCAYEDAVIQASPPAASMHLIGEVLGDASQALTSAGTMHFERGDRIVVDCSALHRVDFSAAGSILNWAAMRQSDGCLVEFKGIHRLAAAFFGVIGINEHAKVIPRSI